MCLNGMLMSFWCIVGASREDDYRGVFFFAFEHMVLCVCVCS